jgi:hypothetical protein
MLRDGSPILSDVREPTLTIIYEPCGRRGPGESYSDVIVREARGVNEDGLPLPERRVVVAFTTRSTGL